MKRIQACHTRLSAVFEWCFINVYLCVFVRSILNRDGVLYVKLRAGQLPYKDDPQGWKSLLASTVNHHNSGVRAFKVSTPTVILVQLA